MLLLRKMLKALGWLVVLFISLAIILQISGYGYVLTAVEKSVLKGKFGPGIYDLQKFPSASLSASPTPFQWIEAPVNKTLTAAEDQFHNSIASTSFLVIRNDSLLYETYWGEHTPLRTSNSFSMAKSVVGTCVAAAVDQGLMRWDDPIGKHISAVRNREIGKVTIAQMLSMTSGSDWSESGGNPFSDNARAYYGKDLKETLLRIGLEGTPGQKFHYQSGNTAWVGWALEEATGMPLPEFAQRFIWGPIGASSEARWSSDRADSGLVKGFCCLYATSRDFAKLGKLWLQEGQWDSTTVISKTGFQKLIQPPNAENSYCPDVCYGHSLWLENYNGKEFFYARGILGQYIIVIPEDDIIIVRTGHQRMEKNERYHPKDLYKYIDQAYRLIF